MENPYEKELSIAFAVLQKAAKLSQLIISSHDKGVIEKADLSPVTIADFAVQALLISTFKNAFPDDKFVGEEDASDLRANGELLDRVWDLLTRVASASSEGENKEEDSLCKFPESKEQMCNLIDQAGTNSPGGQGSGRFWVFDPIDGTKTYVRGELYAINIGLIIDGKQTLGAIACPNMSLTHQGPLHNTDIDPTGEGCIMYAIKSHGAFIRPMKNGGPSRKLSPQPTNLSLKDIRFVTCTSIADSNLDGIHEIVASRLSVPFPGCDLVAWVLRWAALALGLGNTTVWVYKRRDRYAKAWDHAGAMLLFEETGGKITDVHGKDIDLTAGRKLSANFGFVAAPKDIHGKVLELVHEVLKDQGRQEFLQ